MKRNWMLLLCLLYVIPAYSQITIQFVPEIYGRDVSGLFSCKITNPYGSQQISLTITVTERKAGTVCSIRTPPFRIPPGTNSLPLSAARGASIQFAASHTAQITGLSRSFPEGDYDYCYDINFTNSDNPSDEQCFSYTLAPFADMNLIDPYDRDTICNPRPLLSWEPLIPGVPGAAYQLVLAEIKPGQSATEALNYNLALINQSGLTAPVLPYPSIAPVLVKDKHYAWQVTAYKDQTVLNRSEIWQFTVHCLDSTKNPMVNQGFRTIDDLLKGNYYIADGFIKFALINPYQSGKLKYEIVALNDPSKKIRGLPKLLLATGSNDIVIDLQENSSMEDNHYYILKVWLPNGDVKNLRFIYMEPK